MVPVACAEAVPGIAPGNSTSSARRTLRIARLPPEWSPADGTRDSGAWCSQIEDGHREDFCRVDEIVDAAPLVRLMRESENARPIGHAVRDAGNPIDVLVVVGTRAGDELRRPAEHALNCGFQGPNQGGGARVADRMYDHQVAQLISQARGVSGGTFEQRFDFRLRVFEAFLEQETAVEDGRAPVGD